MKNIENMAELVEKSTSLLNVSIESVELAPKVTKIIKSSGTNSSKTNTVPAAKTGSQKSGGTVTPKSTKPDERWLSS